MYVQDFGDRMWDCMKSNSNHFLNSSPPSAPLIFCFRLQCLSTTTWCWWQEKMNQAGVTSFRVPCTSDSSGSRTVRKHWCASSPSCVKSWIWLVVYVYVKLLQNKCIGILIYLFFNLQSQGFSSQSCNHRVTDVKRANNNYFSYWILKYYIHSY